MKTISWRLVTALLFAIITMVLFVIPVFSGTTGKVAGVIKDAETGEPLPGANVVIGENRGASTDLDGYFFIINMPPGKYTVEVSYVGYTPTRKENVVITVDHTTRVDFNLNLAFLETDEVVVTANRFETIAPDISNSRSVLDAEEIRAQTILDFDDLMSNQVSIDLRTGSRSASGSYGGNIQNQEYGFKEGVRIRGGSISETKLLMDGFDLQEEVTNSGFTNFNLNTIQSVEIITGGFNAEYGNVRSGLVNVITKDGKKDYHLGITYRTRVPGQKYHAPALFDPKHNPEWQVYGVPESLTGRPENVPPENVVGSNFDGWEAWGNQKDILHYREIGKPDPNPRRTNNLLTAEQWQELWKWRSRIQEDFHDGYQQWDRNISAYLSGPIWPGWKAVTFFGSYRHEKNWFPLPNSQPYGLDDIGNLKITTRISRDINFTLQGTLNKRSGVALYKNSGVQSFSPVSAAWASRYLLDVTNGTVGWNMSRSISEQTTKMLAFSLNHIINSKMFYEVKVNYFNKYWDTHPPAARKPLFDNDGNLIEENIAYRIDVTDQIDPQYYDPETAYNLIRTDNDKFYYVYDESPSGYRAEDMTDEFGRGIGGGASEVFDAYSKKIASRVDFSVQMDRINFVKFGLEYSQSDLSQYEAQWKPGRNRRWFFARNPKRFAAYIQDKFEFEGMILNAGLRFDWRNSGGVAYDVDPFSDYFKTTEITKVVGWSFPDNPGRPADLADPFPNVPRSKTISQYVFSPRIGVAHPISDNAKLFFNFGYFYQDPETRELALFYVQDANNLYYVGNPNLDFERTISYELGFDMSFAGSYLFHVAGFYKDQSNLVKTYKYLSAEQGAFEYRTFNNDGYGETAGIELRLVKKIGQFFTGSISYEWFSSSFGETGIASYRQGTDEGLFGPVTRTGSTRFYEKPTPNFRADIYFHTPPNWGPELASFYPLGDWSLNILYEWIAGRYFTWNGYSTAEEFGPDELVESNMQWRDHINTNLKITKYMNVEGFNFRIYFQVFNLFNRKELFPDEILWDIDESFHKYMDSLHLPQRSGERHGNDRPGDYEASHIILPNFPQILYLYPREFYLGVEFDF